MAASEYALKEFGFKTRAIENPVTASVGETPAVILRQNPDRIGWLIINLHAANTLYLGYGPDVSSSKGIIVAAAGGVVTSKISEDGEAVGYEVWAKGSASGTTIYVIEYERA